MHRRRRGFEIAAPPAARVSSGASPRAPRVSTTVLAATVALSGACRAAPPPTVVDPSAAVAAWAANGPGPRVAAARTARRDPRPRTAPFRLRSAPASIPRRRRRRIDISFVRAPLEEAIRFLAEAAGVSVVLPDGVSGVVTLDLRRVDPGEALEALAEAHRLTLERRGPIVIVRPR